MEGMGSHLNVSNNCDNGRAHFPHVLSLVTNDKLLMTNH